MPKLAREYDLLSFRLPADVSSEQMDEINRRFEETTFDEILETATYGGRQFINCAATQQERAPVLETIERVFPRHSYHWTIQPAIRPEILGDTEVPISCRSLKYVRKSAQKAKIGLALKATVRIEPIQTQP